MDPQERMAIAQRASVVGIACNVLLVLTKGMAGLMVGSVSVVADAANNLMDAASSILTLVGFKLASKPADEGHPYGHGRYEYLAALGVSVLIIVTGVELVRESVERMLHPASTAFSALTIGALVLSVAIKLALAVYYTRVGKRIGSDAIRAAARDSLNDVVATTAVLVGAYLSRATGVQTDGLLGLAVGLFVLWGGIDLLRDTVDPLLGSMPDPEQVARVRARILSYPGVLGTHDLMIHDYGTGHRFASAHVEMSAEEDPLVTHEILDTIERDLRTSEGLVTILHYDPIVSNGQDLLNLVACAAQRVDGCRSVHDLYIEETQDGLELTFDCVCHPPAGQSNEELIARIEEEVRKVVPHATCHITIDTGFVAVE